MYTKVGATAAGTGGAALAFTGTGMNSLALIVAGATLLAATMAIYKLAPRVKRR